ncbi:MAG: hypothetical protein ACN4E2_00935 [Nitrospinota bacterium]
MMVLYGETFDGEKSLPYLFDLILRLTVNDKLERVAETVKDRSNKQKFISHLLCSGL